VKRLHWTICPKKTSAVVAVKVLDLLSSSGDSTQSQQKVFRRVFCYHFLGVTCPHLDEGLPSIDVVVKPMLNNGSIRSIEFLNSMWSQTISYLTTFLSSYLEANAFPSPEWRPYSFNLKGSDCNETRMESRPIPCKRIL